MTVQGQIISLLSIDELNQTTKPAITDKQMCAVILEKCSKLVFCLYNTTLAFCYEHSCSVLNILNDTNHNHAAYQGAIKNNKTVKKN